MNDMGSAPWKDACVDRLLAAFDGKHVVVRGPNGGELVTGRLMGDGTSGTRRCLIVNDAPPEMWERWHAAPNAKERRAIPVFDHDQWIPLERGLNVNGLIVGS